MTTTSINIEQVDLELQEIVQKVISNSRINKAEGLLFYTKAPLTLLGSLANSIREAKKWEQSFF